MVPESLRPARGGLTVVTICLLPPPVLPRPRTSTAALPALHRDVHDHGWSDDRMEIAANPLGRKGVPGVGARIRAARKSKGLTIRALAELAGVDKGSLTGWELGARDLSLGHLYNLAAALDVPPESLLVPGAPPPVPVVFKVDGPLVCEKCDPRQKRRKRRIRPVMRRAT